MRMQHASISTLGVVSLVDGSQLVGQSAGTWSAKKLTSAQQTLSWSTWRKSWPILPKQGQEFPTALPRMFECIDEDQQSLPDSVGKTGSTALFHVEAQCSNRGLPCPPQHYRKLNCACSLHQVILLVLFY